jgi:hypothetical protein
MKSIFKMPVTLALSCLGHSAFATPVQCSAGYQDSTCLTPIRQGPTAAPTCSTGAGWTTVSPAVWQGYQWSQPQCAYQSQPVCPSGYTTASAATWTGSSWTQPVCVPPQAQTPPPPPQTAAQACQIAIANNGFQSIQEYTAFYGNFPYAGGVAVQDVRFFASGPVAYNPCGDATTGYQVDCLVNPNGSVAVVSWLANLPNCAGGGP